MLHVDERLVMPPLHAERQPEPWVTPAAPAGGFCEDGAAPLEALANTSMAARFSHWRGASGRKYLFSVYAPTACPAYRDAILIAAFVDGDGFRQMAAIEDTGDFPDPVIARIARLRPPLGGRTEIHLHLLIDSTAERRAAIADLAAYVFADSRN